MLYHSDIRYPEQLLKRQQSPLQFLHLRLRQAVPTRLEKALNNHIETLKRAQFRLGFLPWQTKQCQSSESPSERTRYAPKSYPPCRP